MAYDEMLEHLGEFGPYQRRIYLLLCLPSIVNAFHKMVGVFLQAKVNHRCLLPFEEALNSTFYSLPETMKNKSYPLDPKTQKFSSCEMYAANRSGSYLDQYGISSEGDGVRCQHWLYDTSLYESTTVTEWDLVCSNSWLKSTSDAMFMLGILLGSIIFGDLSDRFGRRPIFFLSLVLQVVAGVLAGLVGDVYSFTLLRLVVGATTSGVLLVAYVLALEMVGPRKRMFAGVVILMFFTFGYMMTAGFAYFIRNWRHLQIAITLPGILFFSYYWFIPESARWLLTNGRKEEAKLIIKAVAKENKVDLQDEILDNLLAKSEKEKKEETHVKPSLLDLFRYPNLRKKSLVIFFLWFVNSGTYYGLSWNTSNLGINEFLTFLLAGFVEVPAYCFLLLTLDRWGRKTILCGSMLVAGAFLLLTIFVPAEMRWLSVTFAMVGKLAITASYGTVYVFSGEQFPTAVRNVAMGAGSTFARVGGILAPYGNYAAEIWTPLPLVVYGSLALSGGLLALTLPETHNKKLPDSIEDGEKFGRKTRGKTNNSNGR